jgi:hypothetical protein
MILLMLTFGQPRTLGTEIAGRNLPMPPAAVDLDREITSYRVLDDARWFVIAYYTAEPDQMLQDLVVRRFDKRAGVWKTSTRDAVGSVLGLRYAAGHFYISGHSSPSAAPTVVFDEDLREMAELDGWVVGVLPDGRVIFERSMRHFQPAHAAVLAVYDPRARRERTFYPAEPIDNDRGFEPVPGRDRLALDRSIGEITIGQTTLTFTVRTQEVEITPDGGKPVGEEQSFTVTCRTATAVPTCHRGSPRISRIAADLTDHRGSRGSPRISRIHGFDGFGIRDEGLGTRD